jgi:hypothetical protein
MKHNHVDIDDNYLFIPCIMMCCTSRITMRINVNVINYMKNRIKEQR